MALFLACTLNCEQGEALAAGILWRTEGGQLLAAGGGASGDLLTRLEVTGRGRRQKGSVARGSWTLIYSLPGSSKRAISWVGDLAQR